MLTYNISHSLGVLRWYIPGLAELPIGTRLVLFLTGTSPRFLGFSFPRGTLDFTFIYAPFVSCACVCSEHGTAGEPGSVAAVRVGWRAEGFLPRERSPFTWLGVARASRHERSMNWLCQALICRVRLSLLDSIEVVRNYWRNTFQLNLILGPS